MDDIIDDQGEQDSSVLPRVRIPFFGEDYFSMQDDAEEAVASILEKIIDDAANGYIEDYYKAKVPEYESQRLHSIIDSLVEVT